MTLYIYHNVRTSLQLHHTYYHVLTCMCSRNVRRNKYVSDIQANRANTEAAPRAALLWRGG